MACGDAYTSGIVGRVALNDPRTVEVSHDALYPQSPRRGDLEKMIAGAIKSAIDAHGPITRANVSSAAKRVTGLFNSTHYSCPYCEERLRVNVGLLAENTELKRQSGK